MTDLHFENFRFLGCYWILRFSDVDSAGGVWKCGNQHMHPFFLCNVRPHLFITSRLTEPSAQPATASYGHSWQPWIWESRNLEIQKSGIPESQKIKEIEILRMRICSAQYVGKVLSGSKQKTPGPIWDHFNHVFPWNDKKTTHAYFSIFSLVGQWLLFTRFGPETCPEIGDFSMSWCRARRPPGHI